MHERNGHRAAGLLLSLLLCALLQSTPVHPSPGSASELMLPEGLEWLNVERPLTAEDLRGKVVILDFWTYGCINCIHVVEELRQLEDLFGNKLAVIGVHSPKFDNEKNLETLRNTVVRLDRRHPIVNDPDRFLMNLYRVRAWPTLVLFAPDGRWVGRVSGEGNTDRLMRAIVKIEELYRGEIDGRLLPIALEKARVADSLLAAPGKIAVDAGGLRIAVSDTLHHRVVVADADGGVVRTFGSGEPGLRDGVADEAQLKAPQGLVFGDGVLFVADTGNHAVRLLDLASGQVTTLAGTGRIGLLRSGEYDALYLDLRSPWDLALKGSDLYIAMAGNHQIWRLGLDDGKIGPYAGSRREGIDTGSLDRASFSQPSGLALSGENLYVADAEASAIRRIRMDDEVVENLVGKGLFEFGDRDGERDKAQLQHASGVALLDADRLVIADTYNHKIKLLDLKEGRVTTVLGTGESGSQLGTVSETQLNEPGGVAVLDGRVLVADTNNRRILELDLDGGKVRAWPLRE
jgi:thiol-disulfide isomerase/thioredoxin